MQYFKKIIFLYTFILASIQLKANEQDTFKNYLNIYIQPSYNSYTNYSLVGSIEYARLIYKRIGVLGGFSQAKDLGSFFSKLDPWFFMHYKRYHYGLIIKCLSFKNISSLVSITNFHDELHEYFILNTYTFIEKTKGFEINYKTLLKINNHFYVNMEIGIPYRNKSTYLIDNMTQENYNNEYQKFKWGSVILYTGLVYAF